MRHSEDAVAELNECFSSQTLYVWGAKLRRAWLNRHSNEGNDLVTADGCVKAEIPMLEDIKFPASSSNYSGN